MKCLILAAGKGSRLWREGRSKAMVSLLGVPLIERAIRAALEAGSDELYVISGYRGDEVRRFLDELARKLNVRILHVINDDWAKGDGYSVLKAKAFLDEPFLLLTAGSIFDPSIVPSLAVKPPDEGEITLAVDGYTANPLIESDHIVRIKREGNKLRDIGKGLLPFDAFDPGIVLCTPGLFEELERSTAVDRPTERVGLGARVREWRVSHQSRGSPARPAEDARRQRRFACALDRVGEILSVRQSRPHLESEPRDAKERPVSTEHETFD